jgi:DNA-binding NarL/FixJ family response regulator
LNIPCVLAITKDSLLGFALTNLINASENGLVVIESNAQTLEEFIKEINDNEADVILLEKSSPFAGEAALTKLLMLYPKLLVVIVNEENNWLNIYRREDLLMTSPTDLMNVIQSA